MLTASMIITLVIVVAMIIAIISDKLPFGAPPLIACVLLVVTNQATVAQAFGGFVDKNVILIAGFMAAMAALQKTSFIASLKRALGNMAGKGGYKNYVLLLLMIMFIANFITGTAYYVLILAIVSTIPYNKKLPTSRIVLPAGMATGYGGWIPISTAFFVGLMSSLLESSGVPGVTIPITKFTIYAAICAVLFLLWALIGYKLLPDRDISDTLADAQKADLAKEEAHQLTKFQEICVYVGFVIMIASMIMLSKLPNEVGYGVPGLVAGLFLCVGALKFKELLGSWFSPLIVMMAGVIGVASAMSNCGLTGLLGEKIVALLGTAPSPFLVVLVFAFITSISATFTGASFGSLFIFAPIGIAACLQLGYNPIALAFALVPTAWINWAMPIDGLPAMAMGLGKYKLTEFWKFQIPLWLIQIVATSAIAVAMFPMK
ncbi:MAG TPA: SLC13 family permease [Clostridia bacterium]|nr:SLC13 family permease [Clostridia bacterium]